MIIEEPLPLPPFSLPAQVENPPEPVEEQYRKMPLKDLVQEMSRTANHLVSATLPVTNFSGKIR